VITDKLIYDEGFDPHIARYGVGICCTDWSPVALSTAYRFLDEGPCSLNGLASKLSTEGFTEDQIEYAILNCKVDYFEQAYKSAGIHMYQDQGIRSEEDLYNAVLKEGFTEGQAREGAHRVWLENHWNN